MLIFLAKFALPPALLLIIALLLGAFGQPVPAEGAAGTASSMAVDEFGRNPWGTLALAILLSFGKGLAISLVVALLAAAAAYLAVRDDRQWIQPGLRAACAILESVPLVLWVVIVVVSVHGPRLWITLAAFGILVLPSVTQIFLGEFSRLRTAPFMEAARLLGIAEQRIFIAYLVPAVLPVSIPVLIQVLGNAIAIDGAIGVFGLGSRSDIDLGVFLLRGKEQFVTRPDLLASALLAYGAIYAYLQWLARGIRTANSDGREMVE